MNADPLQYRGATIRLLRSEEAGRLGDAIRAVYGETYPVRWTYDADLVARRIADGLVVSAIAEDDDGTLLCHAALTRHGVRDRVGHTGQAVTVPAARGRHLFTAVKQYLVDWARDHAMAGMYSEATAAHPYSQRANVDLGAHETGFLLGFIPGASADSLSVASSAKESAALFYLRVNPGTLRPVYAPPRHRQIVGHIINVSRFHAYLADPSAESRFPASTTIHDTVDRGNNVVVATVSEPGIDLVEVLCAHRDRVFADGADAIYVDLPMEVPATGVLADDLAHAGFGFSGMFPNSRAAGDVLRLQSLGDATVVAHDIAVASAHGRELLDYVVADLETAGNTVLRVAPEGVAPEGVAPEGVAPATAGSARRPLSPVVHKRATPLTTGPDLTQADPPVGH